MVLGTGAATLILFATTTLTSFAAGVRHRRGAKKRGMRPHYCQVGLLIAAWILFGLTAALLIFALAFNEGTVIQPELVWTALLGSTVAWLLMFGYSEMARQTWGQQLGGRRTGRRQAEHRGDSIPGGGTRSGVGDPV